jgi:hypothetical protein
MCVYVCMCMHVCVCIHVYACVCVHVYVCVRAGVGLPLWVQFSACMYARREVRLLTFCVCFYLCVWKLDYDDFLVAPQHANFSSLLASLGAKYPIASSFKFSTVFHLGRPTPMPPVSLPTLSGAADAAEGSWQAPEADVPIFSCNDTLLAPILCKPTRLGPISRHPSHTRTLFSTKCHCQIGHNAAEVT